MFSGLREPGRIRAGIAQVILTAIIILVVFAAVQFTMQSFRVEGHSMEPTYPDGEYIVVNKLSYRFGSPHRGDVVFFRNPQMPDHLYIKRIVGLPGDTVEIRNGRFYVNGSLLEESPEFGAILCENYSVTVPQDRYFVIGDNRTATSGSHTLGLVPRDNIVGKTWICYWPPPEWGLSPNYAAAAG